MDSRKAALKLAEHFRTCSRGFTGAAGQEASPAGPSHASPCPLCEGDREPGSEAWEELFNGLRIVAEGKWAAASSEPARGDLRWITAAPSTGVSEPCRPPLVLVLQAEPECIRVAQTFHDPVLAAPGDLLLGPRESRLGAMFVECWNTYGVAPGDLGPRVAGLSEEVLLAVERLGLDPEAYDEEQLFPRPLSEQDERQAFRRLEKRVAAAYRRDKGQALFREPHSLNELMARARREHSRLRWLLEPRDVEELCVFALFPPESLPLAAQAGTRMTAPGNVVREEASGITFSQPVVFEMIDVHRENDRISIVGRAPDLPETAEKSRLVARLVDGRGRVLKPDEWDWDPEAGAFHVVFTSDSLQTWKLALALVLPHREDVP